MYRVFETQTSLITEVHILSFHTVTLHYFLQLLDGKLQVWTKPVTPEGSFAIATIYMKQQGFPIKSSARLRDIGLTSVRGYKITEVFDGHHLGLFKPNQNLTCVVNPSGIVLVRATVQKGGKGSKHLQYKTFHNSISKDYN